MIKKTLLPILIFIIALSAETLSINYDQNGLKIIEDISREIKFERIESGSGSYTKFLLDENYIPAGIFPETRYYERTFYFAAPQNGEPVLTFSATDISEFNTKELVPARKFEIGPEGIAAPVIVEPEKRIESEYQHAELIYAGRMNNMEIYKAILRPLTFRGKKAVLAKSISISVKFKNPFVNGAMKLIQPENAVEKEILNLDIAKNNPIRYSKEIVKTFLDRKTKWAKIRITEDGIYRISGASLRNAGFDISSAITERIKVYSSAGKDIENNPMLPVWHGAVEVTREVTDSNSNGLFDDSDQIIFFGTGPVSKDPEKLNYYINEYTDDCYYWVDLGIGEASDGKDFPEISVESGSFTDISSFKRQDFSDGRNSLYYEGNVFAWYKNAIAPQNSLRIEFIADNIDTSSPVSVTINHSTEISGNSAAIRYSVNGNDETSILSSATIFRYDFDSSLFNSDSENYIEMTNTGTSSAKYHNGYNLIYTGSVTAGPQDEYFYAETVPGNNYRLLLEDSSGRYLFDITDPYNVKRSLLNDNSCTITSESSVHSYLLFSGAYKTPAAITAYDNTSVETLHSMTSKVDMVIISPDDFYDFLKDDTSGYISAHLEYDNGVNSIKVVNINQISNEFGRGYQEPAATRNFIKYAFENWQTEYVLLAGDGNYYIKGQTGVPEKNYIYTADPNYSSSVGNGSDDFYANLYTTSPYQHVSLGRFTVSSISELRNVISKSISFMKNSNPGPHKTKFLFMADDERSLNGEGTWYEMVHINNTESKIVPSVPDYYNLDKLYLTEYPFEYSSSIGLYVKNKAQEDLVRKINGGINLMLYVGHGSPMQLAHERVFTPGAFSKVSNPDKYFFMIGATCSFGVFNDPEIKYLAEQMLIAPNRGSVGLINAVASVLIGMNENFVNKIFTAAFADPLKKLTIGQALRQAKILYPTGNSAAYMLIGDPALLLFNDSRIVESENSLELTTLKLDSIGSDLNAGVNISDRDGVMNTMIIDAEVKRSYFNYEHWDPDYIKPLEYVLPGNVILSSASFLDNGSSMAKFILPKDITYGDNRAKVLFYGYNNSGREFTGSIDSVSIKGDPEISVTDSMPPEINILFNSTGYIPGNPIGNSPLVIAEISDENGINTSGGLGHKILLEIDGQTVDITSSFQYKLNSYTQGSASYQLADLFSGTHNMKISAWDNFNNYNEKSLSFEVIDESSKSGEWIGNLLNHPNPVKSKGTTFGFAVNDPIELSSYSVTVYTINGRKVKTLNSSIGQITQFQSVYWDGKDEDGDTPANGVYLYVLRAKFNDGKTVSKKGKLIFAR